MRRIKLLIAVMCVFFLLTGFTAIAGNFSADVSVEDESILRNAVNGVGVWLP